MSITITTFFSSSAQIFFLGLVAMVYSVPAPAPAPAPAPEAKPDHLVPLTYTAYIDTPVRFYPQPSQIIHDAPLAYSVYPSYAPLYYKALH